MAIVESCAQFAVETACMAFAVCSAGCEEEIEKKRIELKSRRPVRAHGTRADRKGKLWLASGPSCTFLSQPAAVSLRTPNAAYHAVCNTLLAASLTSHINDHAALVQSCGRAGRDSGPSNLSGIHTCPTPPKVRRPAGGSVAPSTVGFHPFRWLPAGALTPEAVGFQSGVEEP